MSITSDLLRGNTDMIILAFLFENDSYGYEINNNIMQKSDGLFELKEATLYTAFKRLEKQKYISSYWGNQSSGGRRKYYCITSEGKIKLKQMIVEWDMSKKIINSMIEDIKL